MLSRTRRLQLLAIVVCLTCAVFADTLDVKGDNVGSLSTQEIEEQLQVYHSTYANTLPHVYVY